METKTYKGSCHCGAVQFKVETNMDKIISCNCTMCSRSGTLLNFVPAEQFTLEKGEEALSNYHFNKKVIDHLFCKHCGIKPFARGKGWDGKAAIGVNIRCLEDFNDLKVEPVQYDGKKA